MFPLVGQIVPDVHKDCSTFTFTVKCSFTFTVKCSKNSHVEKVRVT